MDTNTPKQTPAPVDIRWSAPVVAHHERSSQWYAIGGAVAIGLAALGIITGNWSFAIVVLLLAGVYFINRNAPPVIREIHITEQGYTFEGIFTPWEDCQDFWIIHTPTFSELNILRKKPGIGRHTAIQTGTMNTTTLRTTLTELLPERAGQHERMVDMIIRFCKL